MSLKKVDYVFFWRGDSVTNFKVVYGRKPKKPGGAAGSYTKDFHQPRKELADALNRAFGIVRGSDTPVEWRWPGGAFAGGRYKPAADFATSGGRMNLRWATDSAPPPWRLTPQPTQETLETLAGTPDLTTEAEADEQREAIVESGETPWLIAVHCEGEGPVLHARLVLERPLPGREYASFQTLPKVVRDAMSDLPDRAPGGFAHLSAGADVSIELAQRILEAFEDSPNVLLVGPPGTGKTVAMQAIADLYKAASEAPAVMFDEDVLHGAFSQASVTLGEQRRAVSLLFHPSYAYEHFVVGLLPHAEEGGQVTVKPHVGPLLELAEFASRDDSDALLILDEFNRGNPAAIFGDTLGLLDSDKRDVAAISTPYAYMNPKTHDGVALAETITLPRRLRILAAMNSADRSVAPLDAALRRRFAIIHVDPDLAHLASHLGADTSGGYEAVTPGTWTEPGHIFALAVDILTAFNERIEFVLGRDFLLGQSVFWHLKGDTVEDALRSLADALDNRVMGTLSLTFTDDDEAFAAVLNISEQPSGPEAATWVSPRGRMARWPKRLELQRFSRFSRTELEHALVRLLDSPIPAAGSVAEDDEDDTQSDV